MSKKSNLSSQLVARVLFFMLNLLATYELHVKHEINARFTYGSIRFFSFVNKIDFYIEFNKFFLMKIMITNLSIEMRLFFCLSVCLSLRNQIFQIEEFNFHCDFNTTPVNLILMKQSESVDSFAHTAAMHTQWHTHTFMRYQTPIHSVSPVQCSCCDSMCTTLISHVTKGDRQRYCAGGQHAFSSTFTHTHSHKHIDTLCLAWRCLQCMLLWHSKFWIFSQHNGVVCFVRVRSISTDAANSHEIQ